MCVFLPVPNPARVTVRALAMNGVTVVTVLAGGTHFLAVLTEETFGAELVTPRPIPASVTGDATSLCHLTGLLALAVPTPVVIQEKTVNHLNAVKLFRKGCETRRGFKMSLS